MAGHLAKKIKGILPGLLIVNNRTQVVPAATASLNYRMTEPTTTSGTVAAAYTAIMPDWFKPSHIGRCLPRESFVVEAQAYFPADTGFGERFSSAGTSAGVS